MHVFMQVTADIQIIPLGVGVSLSEYVVTCEKIITDAGLDSVLHSHGTNVQGEWETVMATG